MPEATKVLIAEDNVVLGDVMRFNLQRSGFDVTLARNGSDAFTIAESQPFDILVTDFEMPGLNGEELCTKIRNELKLEALRIVMCSAKGLEINKEELQSRLKIERILYKPFSIRELVTLLESKPTIPSPHIPNVELNSCLQPNNIAV